MQKHLAHRVATILAAALVAASASTHAQQGISQNEIVIGTVQDLSGPLASWGKDTLDGIRLRIDEANEQGGVNGRKIRLVAEDNGYDPKRTVLATQKMVSQEKIFAMLALMGSSAAHAVMPILMEKKVVSFMPMSSAREMFEPAHPLKFGFAPSYFDGMKSNSARVFQHTKSSKACALFQDDELGLEVLRGAEAGLKTINVELAEKTSYKRGATDFSSQMARLKGANCDFVVLATTARETVGSMTEARKLGFNPAFYGSTPSYTDVISKLGGKAVDGLYADNFVQFPYMDDASQPVRAWANKWKTRFNTDPTVFGVYGYMITDRLIVGLQKAGPNLTLDTFVKAWDSMTIPPDIFGNPTLTFTANKRLGSSLMRVSQLENGRWKVVMDYPKQ